ncbi:hypothetical protein [Bailinhaonella thermotolerans]|uniref:Uncharacterized protein n=1 Tax=Bailinhaonella thermotolerans TaxID=1070861 RepID=A0A3A4A7F3_9ACTN|nr:hypothetical protein [Bailinhaonella thermotolerans]RJL23921.1 hypothetical protein D5H75_31275 [Bailinhaonella thermotolerans]
MRISARAFLVAMATAVAVVSANLAAVPASAHSDDPTLAALTKVVPQIVEEAKAVPPTVIPEGDVQRPFAAATDPGHTLSVSVSENEVGIGVPDAAGAGNQALPGLVTYAARQPSVSFAHQRTGQIARALTVIHDASAPTEYRFPISAPEGSMLEVEEDDGTVLIYNNDFYLAEIDLPWAKDANGNPVPTSYRVEGMTLIQTVNHAGAAYPVVADPALKLQCEWWKAMCRVIFSKKLTNQIYGSWLYAGAAGAVKVADAACDKAKNSRIKLACKVMFAAGIAQYIYKIREAANKKQCFALRIQYPGPIVWGEVRKKSCQSK